MERVLDGARGLVHLGGIAGERPWSDILAASIDGTQRLLESARAAKVERVVIASSHHTADLAAMAEAALGDLSAPAAPGFALWWGVSRNTGSWLAHEPARSDGFVAVDDASAVASAPLAQEPPRLGWDVDAARTRRTTVTRAGTDSTCQPTRRLAQIA